MNVTDWVKQRQNLKIWRKIDVYFRARANNENLGVKGVNQTGSQAFAMRIRFRTI